MVWWINTTYGTLHEPSRHTNTHTHLMRHGTCLNRFKMWPNKAFCTRAFCTYCFFLITQLCIAKHCLRITTTTSASTRTPTAKPKSNRIKWNVDVVHVYLCRWCQTYCPDELRKPIKTCSIQYSCANKYLSISNSILFYKQLLGSHCMYTVHATSCKNEKQHFTMKLSEHLTC